MNSLHFGYINRIMPKANGAHVRDSKTMIVGLICFLISWIGSAILYQIALASFYSTYLMQPVAVINPYRCGGNRSLTMLEVLAEKRLYKQASMNSERTIEYTELRPLWLRLSGAILDLFFIVSIIQFNLFLFSIHSGLAGMLGIGYMGIGTVLFFFHLLWYGQIGAIGYHVRFIFYLILWPVFAVFVLQET